MGGDLVLAGYRHVRHVVRQREARITRARPAELLIGDVELLALSLDPAGQIRGDALDHGAQSAQPLARYLDERVERRQRLRERRLALLGVLARAAKLSFQRRLASGQLVHPGAGRARYEIGFGEPVPSGPDLRQPSGGLPTLFVRRLARLKRSGLRFGDRLRLAAQFTDLVRLPKYRLVRMQRVEPLRDRGKVRLHLPCPDTPDTTTRDLTLAEARTITRDVTTPIERRDQIWRTLIARSRATPDPWQLAATWMLLPALKSATYRISHTTRLDIADLRSVVIVGFLEALAAIDPDRDNLGSALYWSAYRAGQAACRPERQANPTDEIDRIAARITDTPPPVHQGVVETTSVGYPARSRLEAERLGSIAHRMGVADRLHQTSRCRRQTARQDHGGGLPGRRVVLRVCATAIRNIANVPTQQADYGAKHQRATRQQTPRAATMPPLT